MNPRHRCGHKPGHTHGLCLGLAGIAAFVLNIGSWRETAGFVLLCLILTCKVMEESESRVPHCCLSSWRLRKDLKTSLPSICKASVITACFFSQAHSDKPQTRWEPQTVDFVLCSKMLTLKNTAWGASRVAQEKRICLPVQETQVRSLI